MKKYMAVAATTDKCVENWGGTSEFTNKAISQLADSAIGKLVLLDFDETKRVGKIIESKNENGDLVIKFVIEDKNFDVDIKMRCVPGFKVDSDKWVEPKEGVHRIIDEAESISYGLTYKPAEKDLPEIKSIT